MSALGTRLLKQCRRGTDGSKRSFCGECLTCAAALMIARLKKERTCWEQTARSLAKELGKEEYADAQYENELATYE